MNLLVVLPVGPGDVELATRTLKWAIKLDGMIEARCLLATDHPEPALESLARSLFAKLDTVELDPCPYPRAWPGPQNWAWQRVARFIREHSEQLPPVWFWWEPDAIPVRKGWLETLFRRYEEGRKPFAGVRVGIPQGQYVAGVGFYPSNTADRLINALRVHSTPFDIAAGVLDGSWRMATDLSPELCHRVADNTRDHTINSATFAPLVHEEAVLFHPCKNPSLIEWLEGVKKRKKGVERGEKLDERRNSFHHSGDLGDIIYSLPTIRELGGGDLYLSPDNRTPMSTREKMNPSRCELMRDLLLLQPYIHSVQYTETMPPDVDYDLNHMRMLIRREKIDAKPGYNLARCYLRTFGLPLDHDGPKWLSVDRPVRMPGKPVVIARSSRYQNDAFDWRRLTGLYKGRMVFVGTPDEHQDFCAKWGEIPFQPTSTLLDLARLIAGAELFVGNQSCPYAIAEGLKVPAILEPCPGGSNTLFSRPTVTVGFAADTRAPAVEEVVAPPPRLAGKVRIRGIPEDFTGIGQATEAIAFGLAEGGVGVKFVPVVPPAKPTRLGKLAVADVRGKVPVLTILPLTWVPEHLKENDHLFTMWETTKPPREIVDVINLRARSLVVPSDWCATVFACGGVRVPIRVVPLGVDLGVFRPGERAPGPLTLGIAGRYAHGGIRKGIERGVEAFLAAYKGRDDVRLKVKLHQDCKVEIPADPRIEVCRDFLAAPALADWYRSLSAFLCLSLGEGFGLHPLQAMACGVPVIGPRHTGLGMFHSEESGWVLPWRFEESKEGGHWHAPVVEELPDLLRKLADCPQLAEQKSPGAIRTASRFPWSNTVNILSRFL